MEVLRASAQPGGSGYKEHRSPDFLVPTLRVGMQNQTLQRRFAGQSATRSVAGGIPTRSVGTRKPLLHGNHTYWQNEVL